MTLKMKTENQISKTEENSERMKKDTKKLRIKKRRLNKN
jgi:hypothetical protein